MFKRLLASTEDRRCQACFAAKPCVRCLRSGRPLGKLTTHGPVCNSCYPYFVEPRRCEVCGQASRRLSALHTASGDKKACPSCHRSTQHTCASCRKHRLCTIAADGSWRCRLCAEAGEVPCTSCLAPMPAGSGKQCEACYWVKSCEHRSSQLLELLRSTRAREAFAEFSVWLPTQSSAQRAALKLAKHVEFFELLDSVSDQAWTGEFLLERFGPAVLRRYELPVRWLQLSGGVAMPAEDKERAADARRVRRAASSMPEGTVARQLLEAFEQELVRRRDAGKLTERSMRLACRPAVALLVEEDPHGCRLPTQAALDRYIASTPGQRAAMSTFVGFLRRCRGIELHLPAKRGAGSSAAGRKALEKQIAALMAPSVDRKRIAKRWVPLALRYFHHVSVSDAKTLCARSTVTPSAGGLVLSCEGQDYWIPAEPMSSPSMTASPSPAGPDRRSSARSHRSREN